MWVVFSVAPGRSPGDTRFSGSMGSCWPCAALAQPAYLQDLARSTRSTNRISSSSSDGCRSLGNLDLWNWRALAGSVALLVIILLFVFLVLAIARVIVRYTSLGALVHMVDETEEHGR